MPPLMLQPLLENAVYHGVEPGTGIGDVLVIATGGIAGAAGAAAGKAG